MNGADYAPATGLGDALPVTRRDTEPALGIQGDIGRALKHSLSA